MWSNARNAALPLIAVLAGCTGDATGVPAARSVGVSFSTSSLTAAPSVSSALRSNVTVTGSGNTLVITRVQMVLREIELKQSATAVCAAGTSSESCEELKIGPVLVDLPLTPGVVTALTAAVPAGTYQEVEFNIHKPGDDDASDKSFVTANPDFANSSVRVEGTYNGTPFVFTSAVSQDVELEFNPPLVVDASAPNLTIQVDVGSWFSDAGGSVIDPASANPGQPNASLVAAKIRASLAAMDDDDRDGKADGR